MPGSGGPRCSTGARTNAIANVSTVACAGRARRLDRIAAGTWTGLDRYATHRAFVRALRDRDAARAEQIVIDDAQGGLDDLRSW